jgi:hypothetical protein
LVCIFKILSGIPIQTNKIPIYELALCFGLTRCPFQIQNYSFESFEQSVSFLSLPNCQSQIELYQSSIQQVAINFDHMILEHFSQLQYKIIEDVLLNSLLRIP